MLQWVEPINVWIGLPLALVLFFFDKIVASVKRARESPVTEFRAAKKQREAMNDWNDPQKLYEAIVGTFDKAYVLFRPTSFWIPKRLLSVARGGVEKVFRRASPQDRKSALLKEWGTLLYLLNTLIAVRNFVNFVLYVAFVFLLCALYVSDNIHACPRA